jgi:hypothetical protein
MGKSPLLADLTVRILNGLPWCGRDVRRRNVIVFDFETPGPTYRRNIQHIANRFRVPLPDVPRELEVYLEHDDAKAPATETLLSKLAAPLPERLQFLANVLAAKPDALMIIDPLELLFRIDTGKKTQVLALYGDLRRLLANFKRAAILCTFNLRKKDRRAERVNLLSNPREWLDEVCGSGDILNRSDVRLGIDFHWGDPDTRVLNGVRRGEDMQPLLIRSVGEPDGLAGFEHVRADSLDLLSALTAKQREHWQNLPNEFNFEYVADSYVPRTSLYRLLSIAKSLGAIEHIGTRYKKLVGCAAGLGANDCCHR